VECVIVGESGEDCSWVEIEGGFSKSALIGILSLSVTSELDNMNSESNEESN